MFMIHKPDIKVVKTIILQSLLVSVLLSTYYVTTFSIAHSLSNDNEDDDANVEQEKDDDKQVFKLRVGYKSYPIKYTINGGDLVNITVPRSDILEVSINPSTSGTIVLEIPKSISLLKENIFDFEQLRTITLKFDANTTSLKVRGLTQVSNFGDLKGSKDRQINSNSQNYNNGNIIMKSGASNSSTAKITLKDLPQIIQLVDPGWENYNLTIRAMINNGNITYEDDYKSGSSGVSDWNPLLLFQVPNIKPGLGLTNVGHVSIVPIKLYKDSEDMLKSLHLWKNIPLNEEVVFRLPNRGLNLIIAEVQFSNGVKALYGAAFTVDVHESKSDGTETFNEERSQDKKKIIKEIKLSTSSENPEDQEYLAAAENISCKVHKSEGFDICQ
jgi:hypothetical protein